MAKINKNNNRSYNNYRNKNNNYNGNRNYKKNTTDRNNYRKINDLNTTTRIRIDEERINDSESLDTSFLEGRTSKRVDNNKKLKNKILKEKKTRSEKVHFGLVKVTFYMLGVLCVLILVLLMFISKDSNKNNVKVDKDVEKEVDVVIKEENVIDKNYLFIGDFNTKDFDFEKFNLDYHYVKVSENNYQTKDVLDDMKNNVYKYNPSVVLIELGINDLSDGVSDKDIVNNLENIVKGIKKNRPYALIYVESIYPINKDVDNYDDKILDEDIDNDRIVELNKKIKKMTLENKINYLDLYQELIEEDKLKDNYTDDGVHLSEDGYKRIFKTISKVLDDGE